MTKKIPKGDTDAQIAALTERLKALAGDDIETDEPENVVLPPEPVPEGRKEEDFEVKYPAKAGIAMADLAVDPLLNAKQIAKALNLPEATIKAFVKRVKGIYHPLTSELHRVQSKNLLELIEDRYYRALHYLDDHLLMQGNARDLAYVIKELHTIRSLMRGEPTQIFTAADRKKLDVLLPAFIAESKRRGITIDQNGNVVEGGG